MKTKLGLLKDIQGNIIDTCVVCGSEFSNPGKKPEHVFLCSKECSTEFRKPDRTDIIKQLYKEQFLMRGQNE